MFVWPQRLRPSPRSLEQGGGRVPHDGRSDLACPPSRPESKTETAASENQGGSVKVGGWVGGGFHGNGARWLTFSFLFSFKFKDESGGAARGAAPANSAARLLLGTSDTTRHNMTQHDTTRHNMTQCDIMRHNTIQRNTTGQHAVAPSRACVLHGGRMQWESDGQSVTRGCSVVTAADGSARVCDNAA